MPRGDKSAYTAKQKRQARDIEEGYEKRGVSEKESERRAWATVNKLSGGGLKRKDEAAPKKSGRTGKRAAAAPARKSATKKSAGRKSAARKSVGKKAARRSASG